MICCGIGWRIFLNVSTTRESFSLISSVWESRFRARHQSNRVLVFVSSPSSLLFFGFFIPLSSEFFCLQAAIYRVNSVWRLYFTMCWSFYEQGVMDEIPSLQLFAVEAIEAIGYLWEKYQKDDERFLQFKRWVGPCARGTRFAPFPSFSLFSLISLSSFLLLHLISVSQTPSLQRPFSTTVYFYCVVPFLRSTGGESSELCRRYLTVGFRYFSCATCSYGHKTEMNMHAEAVARLLPHPFNGKRPSYGARVVRPRFYSVICVFITISVCFSFCVLDLLLE